MVRKIRVANWDEYKMVTVKVDADKCIGDGICVDVCPVDVFELKEVGGKTIL